MRRVNRSDAQKTINVALFLQEVMPEGGKRVLYFAAIKIARNGAGWPSAVSCSFSGCKNSRSE